MNFERCFRPLCLLWALALMLVAAPAGAGELDLTLRAIPEWHVTRSDSPFGAAQGLLEAGRSDWRSEAELRLRSGGWRGVLTARQETLQGLETRRETVLNELLWEGDWQGQRLSAGKKIISWDVGFAFRPLDVIQQENRRSLFVTTLEGVPFLAWESFGDTDAHTLVLANPGRGQARLARDDGALAYRYYHRSESGDRYGVGRLSARNGLELGAALSEVLDEGLEWHGSLLWQQRYQRQGQSLKADGEWLASQSPLQTRSYTQGLRALVGGTWTGEGGLSLLAEAWYDGNARSRNEWTQIQQLARRQAALGAQGLAPAAAVAGNLAWTYQLWNSPNLLRRNLLLRLSHRAEGNWADPAVEWLATPEDGGRVITFSLSREANRYKLDAGLRFFGGAGDAVYRQMLEARMLYVALQYPL